MHTLIVRQRDASLCLRCLECHHCCWVSTWGKRKPQGTPRSYGTKKNKDYKCFSDLFRSETKTYPFQAEAPCHRTPFLPGFFYFLSTCEQCFTGVCIIITLPHSIRLVTNGEPEQRLIICIGCKTMEHGKPTTRSEWNISKAGKAQDRLHSHFVLQCLKLH
jgi:hypothetical protein